MAPALVFSVFGFSAAAVAAAASVTDMRTGLHPHHTRLVLVLSDEVAFSVRLVDNLAPLIVDFPELDVHLPPDRLSMPTIGVIDSVKFEAAAPGNTQLVVDLASPARVKHAFLMAPEGAEPYRFVLDLEGTNADSLARTPSAGAAPAVEQRQQRLAMAPAASDSDTKVVAAGSSTEGEREVAAVRDLAGVDRDALILELLMRIESLERQLASRGIIQAPVADIGATGPDQHTPDIQAERARPASERQAPGALAIDERAAERALERSLTQVGALLLMPGQVEVEPSFRYLRRDQAGPLLVSTLGVTQVATTRLRSNEFEAAVDARLGLPWDSQFELGLPFAYNELSAVVQSATASGSSGVSEQTTNVTGVGDVRVGFAKTLLRENGWWPDLVGRVEWDADTGATRKGIPLGTGFNELTGEVTAVKRQDPLAFVGRVGHRFVFENGRVNPGDELFFSLGAQLALSPETSLNASFDHTFAREVSVDGEDVPGSDLVSGVFTLGTSSIIDSGVLVSLTGGIGLTEDAPDYFIQLSIPVRFDIPLP